MGIHIKLNLPRIAQKFDVIDDSVRLYAQNAFYRHMQDYIPFEQGALQRTVVIDKTGITFTQPYARYVYIGKRMVDASTGRGPHYIPNVGYRYRKGAKLVPTDAPLRYSHEVHPLACDHWGNAAWLAKKDVIAREVEAQIRRSRHNG